MTSKINNLFKIFRPKQKSILTANIVKQLTYNQLQTELYQILKKLGLKPIITKYFFPPNNGEEVSIDEVNLNNGCKVTLQISNSHSPLLIINIFGPKNKIDNYNNKLTNSTQLLRKDGIELALDNLDNKNNDPQLIIRQTLNPTDEITSIIKNTLKYLR